MIFIEPPAGDLPVLQVVDSAKRRLEINASAITEKAVQHAVAQACKRGVDVRIMTPRSTPAVGPLRSDKVGGCPQYKQQPQSFQGVSASDDANFVVADPKGDPKAEIGTMAFSARGFDGQRGYAWMTSNAKVVKALHRLFQSDWSRDLPKKMVRNTLVLSPGSENVVGALLQKPGVVEIETGNITGTDALLQTMASRYKNIRLIAPGDVSKRSQAALSALSNAGVTVRQLPNLSISGTMIVTAKIGFMGSQVMSSQSLQENREVGVAFKTSGAVSRLQDRFARDWYASKPVNPPGNQSNKGRKKNK